MSSIDELFERLGRQPDFSNYTAGLLIRDKGLTGEDVDKLTEAMALPDEDFFERRERRSWLDRLLDEGDSIEITQGRYHRNLAGFHDISSEQALVKGRLQFAIEYMIGLADLVAPTGSELVSREFSDQEKEALRNIYQEFRTKDYAAIKIIEGRTNQDVVAANSWVVVRADQIGIDPNLIRGIAHFARTSDDVNANVTGKLYMGAFRSFTISLGRLVGSLAKKAEDHTTTTCVARTHGQEAQLTTLGHIYANLAEQIRLHAAPFLQDESFRLEGKIAGATGTDIDMKAAFPHLPVRDLYRRIVGGVFDLEYLELGNDQSLSHAAFARMLDGIQNIGLAVSKGATDTWIYASRHILSKATKLGESGSSSMPQKVNPFFAESAEALFDIVGGMMAPIKRNMVSYREQGDLRRSITSREAFHPIMLSIIALDRMNSELKNYDPNILGVEAELLKCGPQIASSAIQTYLRSRGVADAYDRIKDIVMKPFVKPDEVQTYIDKAVQDGVLKRKDAGHVTEMMHSVMDTEGLMGKIQSAEPHEIGALLQNLRDANSAYGPRSTLLGGTVDDTERMIQNARETVESLREYAV